MELKTSKAQQEVWQWKETAYEEMKHLSTSEQIEFIHEQTKELVERIRKKKQQVSNGQVANKLNSQSWLMK